MTDYSKDMQFIRKLNREAQLFWDRLDWIERYKAENKCSAADAREAWQMAKWLRKL